MTDLAFESPWLLFLLLAVPVLAVAPDCGVDAWGLRQ